MNTQVQYVSVAQAEPAERAAFIRRTYLHLAGAVAAFIGIETLLVNSPVAFWLLRVIASNRYGWLLILGGFALLGWMARSMAANVTSVGAQYAGLALYVVVEAIIFAPLLLIAVYYSSPTVLPTAALLTGLLFVGLTVVAFTNRADFSFLQTMLTIGGFVAMGMIIGSAIFGFNLGLFFSVGMVLLACASILYDTSRILRTYSTEQHVGAALELFASVALLFWYILRILMSRRR
jgi:FtsH-binding integral membrane protein